MIIIAAHSALATGYQAVLQFFLPGTEFVIFNAFLRDPDLDHELDEWFSRQDSDQDFIVFTDLLSGSVTRAFLAKAQTFRVHVIASVNLDCILDFMMSEEPDLKKRIQEAIEFARGNLCYVNERVDHL